MSRNSSSEHTPALPLQMEQLHDKILAKRAETERQLGQISAAIDVAMRSASAGALLEAAGQPPAAFLALPRFQVCMGRVNPGLRVS